MGAVQVQVATPAHIVLAPKGNAVPSHSKIRDNKQELRGCHWRWPQGAHAGGCLLQLGRGQDGGGKIGLPPRCGGGTPGEELHLGGARQGAGERATWEEGSPVRQVPLLQQTAR